MRLWAKAIEAKRKKMSFYVTKEGISAQKTIQCSQELDKLLLPYEKRKNGSLLKIHETFDGAAYTIILSGELDYFSIEYLYQTIENLEIYSIDMMTIDLTELQFIDSTGYGTILQAIVDLGSKGISINIIGLKNQQQMQLYMETLYIVIE